VIYVDRLLGITIGGMNGSRAVIFILLFFIGGGR